MEFRIAATFRKSLGKLSNNEQKEVKQAAFDLQLDHAHPSFNFHRVEQAQESNLWSARVGRDLRFIVYKEEDQLLILYVDHHDAAYNWAKRRKIERHATTGVAQLVEIRELVREIDPIQSTSAPLPKTPEKNRPKRLFDWVREEQLLGYGVPDAWLADVRNADEESLYKLIDHLPETVGLALLELAEGKLPPMPEKVAPEVADEVFEAFPVVTSDELKRALEYPWDQWSIFLHPTQRNYVTQTYRGPARIAGSAGTGKTVVALHRAVHLARQNPSGIVLITTHSAALAESLNVLLLRLVDKGSAERNRIIIHAMPELRDELYQTHFGAFSLVDDEEMKGILKEASTAVENHDFSSLFLWNEWQNVVDAWQLHTWEAYRDVLRLGRRQRLSTQKRELLWTIFSDVWARLAVQNKITSAMMFGRLAKQITPEQSPYNYIVVDESQDLGVPDVRLLGVLGQKHPESLFFTGDLGQRIFQQPFSWQELGVSVRGRSYTLKTNYRTSHQIRKTADRLLDKELQDVDHICETRDGTVSVFTGPPPDIQLFETVDEEVQAVGTWIKKRIAEGTQRQAMGVIVRSLAEVERALAAVSVAGEEAVVLDEWIRPKAGKVVVCTMYLAKGLEFSAVAVMGCDEDVIPLASRLATVSDSADLEDAYHTERHLLYVALTRARDRLLVSGIEPGSDFLDDLR